MSRISINNLLGWAKKSDSFHQTAAELAPDRSQKQVDNEDLSMDEINFLMSIENEFKKEAEDILESLNLSHLRVPIQK